MPVHCLADIDLAQEIGRPCTPSPTFWEDEVLYFLLVDRFSDGREAGCRDIAGRPSPGTTPLFTPADEANAVQTAGDAAAWRDAGVRWTGGTIAGLQSKLGYLKRLGVTALWLSPVFKQVPHVDSYHGYGIQDFLEVDPHLGTREELRDFVRQAHEAGIRVILDVVLNHAGDVFEYDADRYETTSDGQTYRDARWDGRPYKVKGFRDRQGHAVLPFPSNGGVVDHDSAVWPAELQRSETFTRKGRICNWEHFPEYLEGDFFGLKDIHLGERGVWPGTSDEDPGHYAPSPALRALCAIYKYWIAYLDVDGFRVDTVKHMDLGATRFFCTSIHEFAERIGKSRFYLIGEITGGRERAFDTREVTGLDAALGIDDVQDRLEGVIKGDRDPREYFDLFRNAAELDRDSHRWFRDKVITQIDDHDQVRRGKNKARFCAGDPSHRRLVVPAMALNALTLGIPCIYYGTEQEFDGSGSGDSADRYIREDMFGGPFGAFRTRGVHFFDESSGTYQAIASLLQVRREHLALRRGRQYLREISGDGLHFGYPVVVGGEMRSVIAWSRILDDMEVLVALNNDISVARTAWVTVDDELNPVGRVLECVYSTQAGQEGTRVAVQARNGKAVSITVPAAGVAIYVPR